MLRDAASGGTNSVSQLNLTLLVTPNGGYPTNTTRVTSGTLTTIGNDAYPTSGDGSTASASAAFSAGTTATTLTDALTAEINSGSPTLQTVTNGPNSFSPSSASFTITENLLLDPNNQTVNTLKLNSVALRFTTTPEPASIAILLFALGGLAAVRRRRAS